ncbi:hypothetical protein JNE43_02750 [Kocuria rhizophila]|uniref:hypothetical protein n=1 Tax=Kocuria rhizophila TaxID=72000 RepID=UPI001D5EE77D|nr:hypothetical protein [Kocuria rhizophila]MCC5673748.1 hypothetical protein [Kocuria rhizophila]
MSTAVPSPSRKRRKSTSRRLLLGLSAVLILALAGLAITAGFRHHQEKNLEAEATTRYAFPVDIPDDVPLTFPRDQTASPIGVVATYLRDTKSKWVNAGLGGFSYPIQTINVVGNDVVVTLSLDSRRIYGYTEGIDARDILYWVIDTLRAHSDNRTIQVLDEVQVESSDGVTKDREDIFHRDS